VTTDWTSDCGRVRLICGDCREVVPTIGPVDAVVTDPPYLTGATGVPIVGCGVAERVQDSESVGMPWGYSMDWAQLVKPMHWVVFCNYRMLADVCTAFPPSSVFVWRKSNAPRMTRPVPRLDCEFIVWSRSDKATCGRMGEFQSLVLDVPMPQAGCMAVERLTEPNSGKALHPCQKPVAVVAPFCERLPVETVCDPFMGTGTTGIACIRTGRRFMGIEKDPTYYDIARKRIERELAQGLLPLTDAPAPRGVQWEMGGGETKGGEE